MPNPRSKIRARRITHRLPFWILAFVFVDSGCARPPGVIFPPPAKPIVWPAPPERARIRYVGQLVTAADLKPAIGFGEGMGQALFGKRDVQSMLTPFAACTDGGDRLFVADSNAQIVHVFNFNTRRYEQWRPGAKQRFSQPVAVAYDAPAGRLFVADTVAACVFVLDRNGALLGKIGGDGTLQRPCGVAFDPKTSRLFVADCGQHQVLIFHPSGELLARLGSRGTEPGRFNFPTAVAVDSQGLIYVCDALNFRIQQFSPDFAPLRQIGRKGDMPGYFSQPKALAIDSQDHLYVIDAHFEAVQVFDSAGQLLMDFGQEGTGPGEFWLPTSIFIDPRNRIWIADSYNRRVQAFDYLPE